MSRDYKSLYIPTLSDGESPKKGTDAESKGPAKRTDAQHIGPVKRAEGQFIKYCSKVLQYPDGSYDLVCSTSADFGPGGWEEQGKTKPEPDWVLVWTDRGYAVRKRKARKDRKTADPKGEDVERAMRRARAQVRRLALANDFKWFVTLTLDQEKVDRYDMKVITRKLNAWLSNMVQRHGLYYVLVPERHQDGAVHFHGFFPDCPALKAVDSGHLDKKGHRVFNLCRWTWGFSTAIELYGDYHSAVAYVCKYIGKDSEKIGGRWYYSGGALRAPVEQYLDLGYRDVLQEYQTQEEYREAVRAAKKAGMPLPERGPLLFQVEVPGKTILVVNGIRPEACGEDVDKV